MTQNNFEGSKSYFETRKSSATSSLSSRRSCRIRAPLGLTAMPCLFGWTPPILCGLKDNWKEDRSHSGSPLQKKTRPCNHFHSGGPIPFHENETPVQSLPLVSPVTCFGAGKSCEHRHAGHGLHNLLPTARCRERAVGLGAGKGQWRQSIQQTPSLQWGAMVFD